MASSSNTIALKKQFENKLHEILQKKRDDNNFFITNDQYKTLIKRVKETKVKKRKETPDYRCLARYDILVVEGQEKLIKPMNELNTTVQYYVTTDKLFDTIHDTHLSTGHGGRNRIVQELKNNYCNITKETIMLYLPLCKQCQEKRPSVKKAIVTRPKIINHLNSRARIDLIDMQYQPCNNFRFIMVYQDLLTKFLILKALKTKTAEEVAYHLLDIFTILGAPVILQSNNGREFSKRVVTELSCMCKEMKLVHGIPKQNQSQGSNCEIENMLCSWMSDNQSDDWVAGLKFVQFMKNRALHEDIKRSPFEALFGCKARLGLASTTLPVDIIQVLETEEELEKLINDNEKDEVDELEETASFCCVCSELARKYTCVICEGFVHDTCGETKEENNVTAVTCKLCLESVAIYNSRNSVRESLEGQAKKMKSSNRKFGAFGKAKGDVLLPIPDVDPRNLVTAVFGVVDEEL